MNHALFVHHTLQTLTRVGRSISISLENEPVVHTADRNRKSKDLQRLKSPSRDVQPLIGYGHVVQETGGGVVIGATSRAWRIVCATCQTQRGSTSKTPRRIWGFGRAVKATDLS